MEELISKLHAVLGAANTVQEVEAIRVNFLGRNGSITLLFEKLKSLPNEEKKAYGAHINSVKQQAEKLISESLATVSEKELISKLNAAEAVDLSTPASVELGSFHPRSLVLKDLEEIFESMGFYVEDYSETVTDYDCFESLNIPAHHPARDMQDTFYLNNGQVLKTHTSAAQNHIMRKYGVPVKAIFPGRCFRAEATDAKHETTFYQMEGIMVDEGISISNLIYFMKTMLSEVFKTDIKVRLRPGFFPFVEPGFELDIACTICGGGGCQSCGNAGWLELCPCGMIHPAVLKEAGIDPEKYSGFAFGLGVDRLVMMRYKCKDIRDLNKGNLKFLSQFKGGA